METLSDRTTTELQATLEEINAFLGTNLYQYFIEGCEGYHAMAIGNGLNMDIKEIGILFKREAEFGRAQQSLEMQNFFIQLRDEIKRELNNR